MGSTAGHPIRRAARTHDTYAASRRSACSTPPCVSASFRKPRYFQLVIVETRTPKLAEASFNERPWHTVKRIATRSLAVNRLNAFGFNSTTAAGAG